MALSIWNFMLNIIFFGTPEFAVPSLKILNKNFKIAAVFCEPDKPFGRKQEIKEPPIKILAKKLGLRVFQPESIKTSAKIIKKLNPDIAVAVAYGQIIPKKILDIPKFGFLNLHPSLLPKYRGPSPIQNAILNDDRKTGITIILLDEKMDHGPILAQKKVKLFGNETTEILYNRLSKIGAKLLVMTLLNCVSGKIKPKEQNHKKTTFTKIIKREDGRINWNKTAEEIERMIRAYHPWPGTFTEIDGKRLKIISASIKNKKLFLERVQLEGKKEMSWEEFKKGNKTLCQKINNKK